MPFDLRAFDSRVRFGDEGGREEMYCRMGIILWEFQNLLPAVSATSSGKTRTVHGKLQYVGNEGSRVLGTFLVQRTVCTGPPFTYLLFPSFIWDRVSKGTVEQKKMYVRSCVAPSLQRPALRGETNALFVFHTDHRSGTLRISLIFLFWLFGIILCVSFLFDSIRSMHLPRETPISS